MKAYAFSMYHERLEKPAGRVQDYVEISLRKWTSASATDYVQELTIMLNGEVVKDQYMAFDRYVITESQMIRNAIATFDTAVAAHPNLGDG